MAIRCKAKPGETHTHSTVAQVKLCFHQQAEIQAEMDEFAAQQRGEIYAEALMSWVCGGGDSYDGRRYAEVVSRGEVWQGW